MGLFEIWEKNYKSRRYNKYPYNEIISFVFRHFGKREDRSSIKILEMGCGGGNNLLFLMNEGFDFYSIDISEASIELVKNVLGQNYNDKKILKGRFNDLPFEDNFFDAIIDRASITCNLSEDLPLIYNEVYRSLKSKGIFFSTDMFSDDHPELKTAKNIKNNDFSNFEDGIFNAASQIHGYNEKEIDIFFSKFASYKLTKIEKTQLINQEKKLVESTFNVEAVK